MSNLDQRLNNHKLKANNDNPSDTKTNTTRIKQKLISNKYMIYNISPSILNVIT